MFWMKLIVFFSRLTDPLRWWLFQPRGWKNYKNLANWEGVRNLDPNSFSAVINRLSYKSDKWNGVLDCVFPINKPEYFFKDVDSCRDCDDWARIWSAYYSYHNKNVQEWLVATKKPFFKGAHMVAVSYEEDGYHLLNYRRGKKAYASPEEALSELDYWNDGEFKERYQILYKNYKKEING